MHIQIIFKTSYISVTLSRGIGGGFSSKGLNPKVTIDTANNTTTAVILLILINFSFHIYPPFFFESTLTGSFLRKNTFLYNLVFRKQQRLFHKLL